MSRTLSRKYVFHTHTTLFSALRSMAEIQNQLLDSQGWQGRRVLGFKLPAWQRQNAWTDDQCVRFVESAWLGVGLGTFLVNLKSSDASADLILLDGQQRLRALERYWSNEFPVCGDDGKAYYWGELTEQEQSQMLRIPMAWQECRYSTEAELRDAYNRHNFGGAEHRPTERA